MKPWRGMGRMASRSLPTTVLGSWLMEVIAQDNGYVATKHSVEFSTLLNGLTS